MSMYKRPPLRPREAPLKIREPVRPPPPGSFLHSVMRPSPTEHYQRLKQPVYAKKDYLNLLKKNYEAHGLEYKEPDIPEYIPCHRSELKKEPEIVLGDWIYMKVRILKSGIIRIKFDTSIYNLHEKYYSQCKLPPLKNILQAYKSIGFSEEFLDKIKKKFARKVEQQKRVAKVIEDIFNKEPVKKPKKVKKKEVEEIVEDEEEINEDDEEEEEEDDVPDEDGGMDVEVEEDPDEQPEEDEEAYISD